MYPFESRLRWVLSDRALHVAEAARAWARRDTLLAQRLRTLRLWTRVQITLFWLLSAGLVASAITLLSGVLGGPDAFATAVGRATALLGALTGFLTFAYILVARTVGQLEADSLMLIAQLSMEKRQ